MAEFLVELLVFVVGMTVGVTALLSGRRKLWVMLAAVGLYVTLQVTIELLGYDRLWDLVENGEWVWILVAVGMALLGAIIGRTNVRLTHMIIGFLVGVVAMLWLDEIILYALGYSPEAQPTEWWMILLVVLGGVVGLVVTVRYPDTSLILYSSIVGTNLIMNTLHLDPNWRWVAILTLSFLLLGVVMQFAQLLREQKASGLPFSLPDSAPPSSGLW